MKCLIIDAVHSAIAEELGKYMQVDTHMLPTQEELVKLIPDYDVLIMRVDPKITKEIDVYKRQADPCPARPQGAAA